MITSYTEFFSTAFAVQGPFDYQRRLAEDSLVSLVNVPTGAGKTAAVIGAWLWRRIKNPGSVGRRLIYCLPMRTLVEQTERVACNAIERLNKASAFPAEPPTVHVLMGGDVDEEWQWNPERECILIGTQDMLLSRALNRGYAMSRFRWPVHFGLLNNDCLWVIDEVQLLGSGLATTLQMQAFRRKLGALGGPRTIWMSATVEPEWLETVDFEIAQDAPGAPLGLDPKKDIEGSLELKNRWEANKPIEKAKAKASEDDALAKEILKAHLQESRTLVVINTVRRACSLLETLKETKSAAELLLVHSRFRAADRKKIVERLSEEPGQAGMVIVSTQVVEAGVDISAKVLFTELAPWPSLVQRFGRCNRRGKDNETAAVYWIDVPTGGKKSLAPPYDEADLNQAREMLEQFGLQNVGPKALKEFYDVLASKDINKSELFRYEHTHVIHQHDLHGLFSTEADLAGGFTDISHFVRNRESDADVQVYWREFKGEPDRFIPAPEHKELCTVRLFDFKNFLGKKGFAREWNSEVGRWERRYSSEVRPGMTLLLSRDQGGYDDNYGWTSEPRDKPTIYEPLAKPQEFLNDDLPSQTDWWSLPDHLRDAQAEAREVVKEVGLGGSPEGKAVVLAAWWHDTGKSHVKWQTAVERYTMQLRQNADEFLNKNLPAPEAAFVSEFLARAGQVPFDLSPWAKLPDLRDALGRTDLAEATKKSIRRALYVPFVPNMRHEAASALAAWREWQQGADSWTALAVYLVVCHHGKVRTVLRSTGTGGDVFGIASGDALPALGEWLKSEQLLDLSPKMVGAVGNWSEDSFDVLAPSWIGMIAELLGPELPDDPDANFAVPLSEPRSLGPFKLAFLEALIRAADVKASRNPGRGKKR